MPGESRYDSSVFSVHCHPGLDPGSYDKGSVKCSFKKMPGESRHDSSGSLSKDAKSCRT